MNGERHTWVVLVCFKGGEATKYGPYALRSAAARMLCAAARNGAVCRHDCEHCGRDHTTGKEDWYGKLVTRRV